MRSAARRAAGVLAGVLGVALAAAAARAAEAPRSAGDLDAVLDFARRTLAFVERSAPRPALAAELAALDARAAALPPAERQALRDEVLRLRRRILFSHPLLDFDRILINQRTSRIPNHMCDQYLGRHSQPGPGLAVLESWKDEPRVTPLLKDKLPPGATMHPDLSFDGRRVAFAFCDHSATQNREHRAYFIYEATTDGRQVRQVTGGASDPRLGAKGRQTVLVEDFDPCYLPDGGLAFISTRSQQYGRCHGSRYVPAYVLYRADADGSNLRQLSFNEANEWDPAVLHDGRII